MARAGIKGKQATSKGLRHGIAMLSGEKALPLNILRDLMGHSDTKITEIYISAIGAEKRKMVMNAWQ
jgi:integrase